MGTINAGSVIRGDVINLQGSSDPSNGVVESVNKNGSTVAVKIRCSKTGELFSYNLPYSARLDRVVTITR
ncbi:hypothetical protein CNR33_00022 [Pseudomonas phage tabernarius]|uniref:Uncharacterized protein n=1 Tax=Pseudomonas phage tabernarius TaxID=2048978 RepID=A0A2H4P6R8_9CAUD|nr:hypothetical protein FDJ17_gp22 [Pseudomonas phage tabernarius]ATW57868.1 hypothetical protein CNR33_00022 [Pseudomonas phage tabernarius]